MTKKRDIVKELIETGSDISGSVSGAVLGGLVAGPPGAIIGGASGVILSKVFKKVGNEIQQRFLSPREEVRIGAVYGFAISKIKENIAKNESIREDDFFKINQNNRSNSEEIFEGVILSAQKEYEERKVRYLGNLYGNICTDSNISREHANQLIRTANSISYRQLCILQLLNEKSNDNNIKLTGLDDNKLKIGDVIIEIRDLQQRGLITIISRVNTVDDNSSPIVMNDINISENGIHFCDYLSLDEIPRNELDELNNLIKINE